MMCKKIVELHDFTFEWCTKTQTSDFQIWKKFKVSVDQIVSNCSTFKSFLANMSGSNVNQVQTNLPSSTVVPAQGVQAQGIQAQPTGILLGKSSQELEIDLDKKIKKIDVDTYKFNFDGNHSFKAICDISKDHKMLLNHPCNEAYIIGKWQKIQWKLIVNFSAYIIFLLCLTILVILSYWKLLPNGKRFKKAHDY